MTRPFCPARLVLLAKRVHTLGGTRKRIEGVAIRDGLIVAADTRAALRSGASRGTRVVNLGDVTLTPGLIDGHTHFFYWALQKALVIDVTGLRTLQETLARIRRHAARKTVDGWVVAAAFDQNLWGRDFPHARDLDRAVSDRPALVRSRDGHTAWLNSLGLRRAGIFAETPDPPGGRYCRDAHGRPTGIVQEAAVDLLPNPVRSLAQRGDPAAVRAVDRALSVGYQTAWSFGLVGVCCLDDGPSWFHFQRQQQAGRLGIRIVHSIPLASLPHAAALGLGAGLGVGRLRLAAVKIFADGSLGSQTAYMFDEYPSRTGYRGIPVLAGADLKQAAVDAASRGWPVWVHAIGDRAVHDAIDAIVAARRVERQPLTHRIEHAQCVRPLDLRRMARAGIIASVQPCHMLADIATADRHWPHARRNAYPLRSMLAAGVTLAAGSDAPVESLDPRRSFFAATCRMDLNGEPAEGWFPKQRISSDQVLRAFTVGAAISAGLGPAAGTLTPGAPADLTIWRDDPLELSPAELLHARIAGCVIGGELHLADHP